MLLNRNPAKHSNDCSVFITLGIYTRWKRVCIVSLLSCMSCPSIWATYLHCSLIYFWVPSSCFCIVISLFWGWNNPVQRYQPVGRLISTPEAVVASRTDWQTVLMATDDDQRQHHHAEHHFQAKHQLTPSCILHRAQHITLTCICMSVIAAFASFSSLAFLSRCR